MRLDEGLKRVSEKSDCLAVLVDSPGGSPAYSHNIFTKLRMHASKTGKPVYTFAEDMAASGGYFILSAGDKAFAQKSSIVGSVGAIFLRQELNRLFENHGIRNTTVASRE